MSRILLSLAFLALLGPSRPAMAGEEAAWEALRAGGVVAILRHTRAPGVGDPANFRLEACETQRNLSDEGRAQARRLGERFREQGVRVARVLSSRWCRALDTARLAFGTVEPEPLLDSFFQGAGQGPAQTRALRDRIAAWANQDGALVMVTHQVNITALTDVFPAEGEILVLRPRKGAGFDLVGRLKLR